MVFLRDWEEAWVLDEMRRVAAVVAEDEETDSTGL